MCIMYIHWFVKHIIRVIYTAQFDEDEVLFGSLMQWNFIIKPLIIYNFPLAQFDGTYTEIIYGW